MEDPEADDVADPDDVAEPDDDAAPEEDAEFDDAEPEDEPDAEKEAVPDDDAEEDPDAETDEDDAEDAEDEVEDDTRLPLVLVEAALPVIELAVDSPDDVVDVALTLEGVDCSAVLERCPVLDGRELLEVNPRVVVLPEELAELPPPSTIASAVSSLDPLLPHAANASGSTRVASRKRRGRTSLVRSE